MKTSKGVIRLFWVWVAIVAGLAAALCAGCTSHNRVGPLCLEGEVILRPIQGRFEVIGQIRRAHKDDVTTQPE